MDDGCEALICLVGAHGDAFFLSSLRNGLREEIGHLPDAGRNETAFRPNETYISDIAHKFIEDSNDIEMAQFIGKGNLGEKADSNTGKNCGPDRFDTIRPEVPA